MHPQATCQLASLLPPCSTGGNSTIRPMPLRLRLDESRLAQPSLLTNCSSFASLVPFVWGKVSRSDQGSSAGDVSSFYSILVSISFLLVSLLAPRHDGRKGEYISRGKMGRRIHSSSRSLRRSQTFVLLVRLSSVPSHSPLEFCETGV